MNEEKKKKSKSKSKSKRSTAAKTAAVARWANRPDEADVRTAQFAGELVIGDTVIDCAVLEDGTRVISQRGFNRALGAKSPPKRQDGLPGYLADCLTV